MKAILQFRHLQHKARQAAQSAFQKRLYKDFKREDFKTKDDYLTERVKQGPKAATCFKTVIITGW